MIVSQLRMEGDQGRLLAVDEAIAETWEELTVASEAHGATAVVHRVTLVKRKVHDFSGFGERHWIPRAGALSAGRLFWGTWKVSEPPATVRNWLTVGRPPPLRCRKTGARSGC
jgi:hypothetical protein